MKIIILTASIKDGNKLKNSLRLLNEDFSTIKNFIKKDILSNPKQFKNTSVIFSTWFMPIFSENELKKYLPALKAVFYSAGSVKYFANPLFNQNIRVFSAVEANAIPVAEFVSAQILLANKGYFQSQKQYKKPFWRFSFNKARSYTLQKKGNYNAKIGIIGCGSVGIKVIDFLKPYNLDISVYDPYISDERILELGVKRSELKQIFSDSDVISNHLPDNPDTKGIINKELLTIMKEHATLINTGRGSQIVEKDLAKVMRIKPNACALLDVTKREPILPWSPLLRIKNIFITPHIAGSLSFEYQRMVEYMLNAYFNFIKGNTDSSEVFKDGIHKQA